MSAFFTSPVFDFLVLLTGFLAGWLIRETILVRRFRIRLLQVDRDRDFAHAELEAALEKASFGEADRKKAAFDAVQFAEKTEAFEADKKRLVISLDQLTSRAASLENESASLKARLHSQEEQILGLRAQNRQLADSAELFSEKEEAEKRLRNDFADALSLATELQKQVARLRQDAERTRHEKEVLKTQLLDYQLKTAEFPNISASAGKHESAKKSARRKTASQPDSPAESPIETPAAEAFSDDLKLINGISSIEEKELEKLDITSLHHLTGLTENQLIEFAEGSRRLIEQLQKEDWIGQARHLVRRAGLSAK